MIEEIKEEIKNRKNKKYDGCGNQLLYKSYVFKLLDKYKSIDKYKLAWEGLKEEPYDWEEGWTWTEYIEYLEKKHNIESE